MAQTKADARVDKYKRRPVTQGADLERAVRRFDADLSRPFMIYVGSSTDRPGSLREHAADRVKYDKIWGTRSNPSLTARIRRYGYTLGGR